MHLDALFFLDNTKGLSDNNVMHLLAVAIILGLIVVGIYLHRRYLFNERLISSNELTWLNELLDSLPDAMLISDENGHIEQVNNKTCMLFGYMEEEFLNLNISNLIPPRFSENHHHNISNFFNKPASREMGQGKSLYAINKYGKEFPVEISLNLVEFDTRKVVIANIRDVTEKKQIEATLIQQANFDSLTQLPNRKLIRDRLLQLINHANRYNKKLGVLFIDLDDFKKINDNFSHQVGDSLLCDVANTLTSLIRAEDVVGRLSGDEFMVIAQNPARKESLITIAKKILAALRQIDLPENNNIQVNSSIGISVYPEDGCTCEDLIRNADLAMYQAKSIGKDTFSFFQDSMLSVASKDFALESALRNAVEKEEFYVVFQPKFEINTLKIIGYEALLRWQSTTYSKMGPDKFVPRLEKLNLINKVGYLALQKSLEAVKHWQSLTNSNIHVAVNVSPSQLKGSGLFESIKKLLKQYQLTGPSLEIELTEQMLIEQSETLIDELIKIKNLGVGIALDDFGTGYSSLNYLTHYPIRALKIDKTFVDGIDINSTNKVKEVLIDTTLYLAKSLNLGVTAEGIETEEQLSYLKQRKCKYGQGYFFSKPLPFHEATLLLQNEHNTKCTACVAHLLKSEQHQESKHNE